jgi:flagellar hook-length control protein FliK
MITFNPGTPRNNMLAESNAMPGAGSAITNPNVDPAGFASLLRQTQESPAPAPAPQPQPLQHAAPAPAPAPSDAEGDKDTPATHKAFGNDAPEPPEAPQGNDAASHARPVAKGQAHASDDAAASSRSSRSSASHAEATKTTSATENGKTAAAPKPTDASATGTGTGTGLDPNVMQWLAGLQRGAATAPGGKGDAQVQTVADDAAAQLPGAFSPGQRAADLKAQDAIQEKAALGLQSADPAVNESFGAILTEQHEADQPVGPRGAADNHVRDAAALGAAAANPFSPTSTAATAAPTSVVVATPLTAPDFAQQLGVHLTVLAKDGVQQAELHLNPADMGPVSVQIVMDGTQAHVAFGADMAATRQAIEAGLPELASALRDAGFTLAGGGVSQHAGGRGGGGGGDSSGSDGQRRGHPVAADTVSRVGAAARRIVTHGGVDLFA